jgi:hypothetical protein
MFRDAAELAHGREEAMTRPAATGTILAIAVLLGTALSADPAGAQQLTLDGVWGNTTGCKYAKDGLYENDDMMVLKPGGIETYVTLCEWVQVATSSNGTQVVTGLCGHEGEGYQTVETYIVEKDHADPTLVRISQSTGDVWGEVRKCP